MDKNEVDKISAVLRNERVTHLMLAKLNDGITLSAIATGDDIYDFLQVLVDQNPVCLNIMRSVIESRKRAPKKQMVN